MTAHHAADARVPSRGLGPTGRIFVGLVLGILIGWLWPSFGTSIKPLADLFLRMIRMIVAPLLFSTLIVGIAGSGDLKALGRIGLKTIVYFEVATTVALGIGLLLVNVFKPGAGMQVPLGADTTAVAGLAQTQQHAWDMVLHLFPTSVVDAMARGDILQVVVFATFFGVAVASIGAAGKPVVEVMESTAQAMFAVTRYVMWFAPIGVCAAIAATVGGKGIGVLLTLARLTAVMYAGYVIFAAMGLIAASVLARVPLRPFMRAVRKPCLIAFSTASSEAALPDALNVMERFGVPKRIVAFVLPTGYSLNLDGTTLYLSLATVFVAQMAGLSLSAGQQFIILITLMLTSKGVAGVPRAALVVLTGMLTQFGLPLEGAAILLGIDQLLDMGRTGLNVLGNCIATVVVARWEGVFDDQRMREFVRQDAV